MVSERYHSDLRQISSKQAMLARRAKALSENHHDRKLRSEINTLKSELKEQIFQIKSRIDQINNKILLPNGKMTVHVRDAINSFELEDLQKTKATKSIILSVGDNFLDFLSQETKRILRHQLHEDIVIIREKLFNLYNWVVERLSSYQGASVLGVSSLRNASSPNEDKIWENIIEIINIEIRYRQEIPKRGFGQLLSSSTSYAFRFMMLAGLAALIFGGLSGERVNIRGTPMFAVIALAILIGGSVWNYNIWKKQDVELLNKEKDRVKDALIDKVNRVLQIVQTKKLEYIRSHLDKVENDTLSLIEQEIEDSKNTLLEKKEHEKQNLRARIHKQEKLSGERRTYEQYVLKLQQACIDIETTSQNLLHQLSRSLKRENL